MNFFSQFSELAIAILLMIGLIVSTSFFIKWMRGKIKFDKVKLSPTSIEFGVSDSNPEEQEEGVQKANASIGKIFWISNLGVFFITFLFCSFLSPFIAEIVCSTVKTNEPVNLVLAVQKIGGGKTVPLEGAKIDIEGVAQDGITNDAGDLTVSFNIVSYGFFPGCSCAETTNINLRIYKDGKTYDHEISAGTEWLKNQESEKYDIILQ
ncbi:MAG: hypothetical protein AAF502_19495 [Bacteroidota bacterium]